MAWTPSFDITGRPGPPGPAGTLTAAVGETLAPGAPVKVELTVDRPNGLALLKLGIPKGDKGDRGPAGTLSSAAARTVPADQPAAVRMSGTTEVKHADFDIPRGLPGVNAIENDEAVSTYIAGLDTKVRQRLNEQFPQLGGHNRFTGRQTFGTRTPRERQPFMSSQIVRATDGGTADHVSHLLETWIRGDWTGDTGPNAGHVWGANIFTVIGEQPGDGNGVKALYGALIEADVAAPAGTYIDLVTGLQAEASFFGELSGAHVRQLRSLRVARPVRKDKATGGTVEELITLSVAPVYDGDLGTAAGKAWTMYVDGGRTYVKGFSMFKSEFVDKTTVTIEGIPDQQNPYLEIRSSAQGTRQFRVTNVGDAHARGTVIGAEGGTGEVALGAIGPAGGTDAQAGIRFGGSTLTPVNLYRQSSTQIRTSAEIRADAGLYTLGPAFASRFTNAAASDRFITWGAGVPTIAAAVGTVYLRTDGGAGSTFYVKEAGTGATGWTAK